MIFRALQQGIGQGWKKRNIFFFLWALNFFWAVLFLSPYFKQFQQFFRHSLVTDILAKRSIYTYYAEFYYYMKNGVAAAQKALSVGNLLYSMLMFFLVAGIIAAFRHRDSFRLPEFLSTSGQFAGRMLRLGLLGIVLFLALAVTALLPSLPFIFWIASSPVEPTFLVAVSGMIMIYGFFLTVGLMILDLSQIFLVEQNLTRVRTALGMGIRYVWRHFLLLLAMYGVLGIGFLLFVLVGNFLILKLPDHRMLWNLLTLLFVQALIFGKLWLKYSRFAALMYVMERKPVTE